MAQKAKVIFRELWLVWNLVWKITYLRVWFSRRIYGWTPIITSKRKVWGFHFTILRRIVEYRLVDSEFVFKNATNIGQGKFKLKFPIPIHIMPFLQFCQLNKFSASMNCKNKENALLLFIFCKLRNFLNISSEVYLGKRIWCR